MTSRRNTQAAGCSEFHAFLIAPTSFQNFDLIQPLELVEQKIDLYYDLFKDLRFIDENIRVLSDIDGQNELQEHISSPFAFTSYFSSELEKCKGGTVLLVFLTPTVMLPSNSLGLCMKKSSKKEQDEWKDVLEISEIGMKLRKSLVENVLMVIESCDGLSMMENQPEFLRRVTKKEDIKSLFVLTSASSEGMQFSNLVDDILRGGGRKSEDGYVTASLLGDQLTEADPKIYEKSEMIGSTDFVLSSFLLVPPIVPHEQIYLDRQSEVESLWEKVCSYEIGTLGIIGVHGMGGIGKTILAQLLLRHPEVKSEFPDGQYWITVGESDNPAELLDDQTQLYRALSKEWYASFDSVGKARTALETIIGNKRCLVVLDDVWKSRNVIGSFGSNAILQDSSCRFVVTTRDSTVIGKGVDTGILHEVSFLSGNETMKLLSEESGVKEEEILTGVASICDRLPIPLVVSLVGGLLREYLESTPDFEEAVNQVCELIDDTGIIYKSVPHALGDHEKTLETTLMSSVEAACRDKDLSKFGVKNLIYDLSVFPDDTKIPKKLLESVWIRRKVPKSVCTRLLAKLVRMSIIQRFENDDNHFGIHDSIRSFMLANSEDVESRHGLVVNVYRDLCENADPWWKGKESESLTREILDYMRVHLTYHLNSMQDHDSIFELVSSLDWIVYQSPSIIILRDCKFLKKSERYKEAARLISSALELSAYSYTKQPTKEGLSFHLHCRLLKNKCKDLDAMMNELGSLHPFEFVKSVLAPAGGSLADVLAGHTGRVGSIALTSDNRRAISGASDETLRLWDLQTGECLKVLIGHIESIKSVALTSNDLYAVSGSVDKTIRVWNLETGECEKTFEGHTGAVTSLALTPDGRHVVSGSNDYTLRVWDLETGKSEKVLQGHSWDINSVAISPNGLIAASSSSDKTIRIWNLETGECKRVLNGHDWDVTSVTITNDNSHVISGSDDKTIRIWNIETGECEKILEGHTWGITSVALTSDGLHLVSASFDKTLILWDLLSGDCEKVLEGHFDGVTSVAISSDDLYAVSGSDDTRIRVWHLQTKDLENDCDNQVRHMSEVTSVASSSDGNRAVSGSSDCTMRVWDLKTGECEKVLEGHTDEVTSVAITANGRRIVSASKDNTARVWSLSKGEWECIYLLKEHTGFVTSAAISSDGRLAITGSYDETLFVWDMQTGHSVKELIGHRWDVTSIQLTSDNRRVVSGANDKKIRVWDVETGDCERVIEGHSWKVTSIAITPNDQKIVSGAQDRTIRVWNLETGECEKVMEGHCHIVTCLALSSDGLHAVSGSFDKTLRVWDLQTGKCVFSVGLAPVSIRGIAISNDTVFYGMTDGSVGILKFKS